MYPQSGTCDMPKRPTLEQLATGERPKRKSGYSPALTVYFDTHPGTLKEFAEYLRILKERKQRPTNEQILSDLTAALPDFPDLKPEALRRWVRANVRPDLIP